MCFLSIFPLAGLVVLVLFIVIKILMLHRQRIKVSSGGSIHQLMAFIIYPVFLFLFILWLGGLIVHTFNIGWHFPQAFLIILIPFPRTLASAGVAVILASLILMFITLLHFNTSFRFGMSEKNKGRLITTGIFSYSRNPFFLSIMLYFIGQALVFPSVLFIATALLAIISIHFHIVKEEKFMLRNYNGEYLEYQKRVRRYF